MRDFVVSVIERYRQDLKQLSEEELRHVSNLEDLRPPCQVEVFWFCNSKLDVNVQLWIISHFNDRRDLEVIVNGPISTAEVSSVLPSLFESARYDRPYPRETSGYQVDSYRPLIEGAVLSLIDTLQEEVRRVLWTSRSPGLLKGRQWLGKEAFQWVLGDDPRGAGVEAIVSDLISSTKRTYESERIRQIRKPLRQAKAPKTSVPGFATYIYPHVWVGDRPKKSLQDRINERMYPTAIRPPADPVVHSAKIIDQNVFVTKNGCLQLCISDKGKCLNALNVIMALLTLRGIPALAVREHELGTVEIGEESGTVTRGNWALSPRTTPEFAFEPRKPWEDFLRKEVQLPVIDDVLKLADRICQEQSVLNLLLFFIEAYTHYHDSEHRQCVIMSWTMLESWLSMKWDSVLQAKSIGGWRNDYLKEFTAGQKLEVFEFGKFINSDLYQDLSVIRRMRNDIVHNRREVSSDEARQALDLCVKVLGQEI